MPQDSARLSIHGNTGINLAGTVLARSTAASGRAAEIDLSSLAAITITGPGASGPAPGSVALSTATLNSWGYGSLLVGGQRIEDSTGVSVNVRSPRVTLDSPGGTLAGADIVLAGNSEVLVSAGSAVRAAGPIGGPAQNLQLGPDGALVRVSTDAGAAVTRSGQPTGTTQKVTIGAGASLAGPSVIVDSTYAADLDSSVDVRAGALTLGSGQISVLLDGSNPVLTGSAVPGHVVLGGALLQRASESDVLRLLSYRTIDFYGSGTLGAPELARVELLASGLRGYGNGTAGAAIRAGDIYLARPNAGMIGLSAPAISAGNLSILGSRLLLGPGQFSISGYDNISATVLGGILADADGSLSVGGKALLEAPALVGRQGAVYDITAAGDLVFNRVGTSVVTPGLGVRMSLQGTSVDLASDVLLPSGVLSVTATTGNIDVSGRLAAEGQARQFFDVTRYTDGGSIDLAARRGSVRLLAGSDVSVGAHADGGDAGYFNVRSPGGVFNIAGTLDGSAGAGRTSGSFTLDAGSVADFDTLRTDLDNAGFFQERNLRVRTGDVTVAGTTRVRDYALSADAGDITVTGIIDASGETGGRISLVTSRNLTLADGSVLTVAAEKFSNAGKGGHIALEAGSAINGVGNTAALLDLQSGSRIDLSVKEFLPGSYTQAQSNLLIGDSDTLDSLAEAYLPAADEAVYRTAFKQRVAELNALDLLTEDPLVLFRPRDGVPDEQRTALLIPGSSAFYGQFEGILHLRAPRTSDGEGMGLAPLSSTIVGASSILAEAFKVYDLSAAGGSMTSLAAFSGSATTLSLADTSAVHFATGTTVAQSVRLSVAGTAFVPAVAVPPVLNATASEVLETTVRAGEITELPGDRSFFLRVTSGAASGAWERVTSSASEVLTIEKAIAGFTQDDSFEIKAPRFSLLSSQSITFPSGVTESVKVITSVGATITRPDNTTLSLAPGTPMPLDSGTKISLNTAGFIDIVDGTAPAVVSIPAAANVELAAGSIVGMNGPGTITRSGGGSLDGVVGLREGIHLDNSLFLGQAAFRETPTYTALKSELLSVHPA